jgi:hypothetical protein
VSSWPRNRSRVHPPRWNALPRSLAVLPRELFQGVLEILSQPFKTMTCGAAVRAAPGCCVAARLGGRAWQIMPAVPSTRVWNPGGERHPMICLDVASIIFKALLGGDSTAARGRATRVRTAAPARWRRARSGPVVMASRADRGDDAGCSTSGEAGPGQMTPEISPSFCAAAGITSRRTHLEPRFLTSTATFDVASDVFLTLQRGPDPPRRVPELGTCRAQ